MRTSPRKTAGHYFHVESDHFFFFVEVKCVFNIEYGYIGSSLSQLGAIGIDSSFVVVVVAAINGLKLTFDREFRVKGNMKYVEHFSE